jgi:flagellar biosynthesis protein FlhF
MNYLTLEQLNPSVLQRGLIAGFQDFVRFAGGIDFSDSKRKTVALIGTSGVGKTTLLAKIAAYYHLKEFKRVALMTTDQYRIGAVEQFEKYAEMLGCPMEVVTEPFRMKSMLKQFQDYDLVLLDTPGTNPKNKARLQFLDSLLDSAHVDEAHLILSATSGLSVQRDTVQRFLPLGPTHLTLTKLDEATGVADLYHFLKDNDLPLRFLTMGQNISEDIEPATAQRLAWLAKED